MQEQLVNIFSVLVQKVSHDMRYKFKAPKERFLEGTFFQYSGGLIRLKH